MFIIKVKYATEAEEELKGVYKSYDDAWCAMTETALDKFLYIRDNEEHKYLVQMHNKNLFHYNDADLIISEDIDSWYNVLVSYRIVKTGVADRHGVYVNITNDDINGMSIFNSRESQLEDFVDRIIERLENSEYAFSSVAEYSRDDIKRLIKSKSRDIDSVLGVLNAGWKLEISDLSFILYYEKPEYTGFTVKSYYRVVN